MSGAQIGYVPTGVEATFETCHAEFEDLAHQNELGRKGWKPVAVYKGTVLMMREKLVLWSGRPRN